ncbi:MAG: cytochrome c oxidase subunit II [Gammaproteobacteria bacterium]
MGKMTDMHDLLTKVCRRLPATVSTLLALLLTSPAYADWKLNMTRGVTSTANEAYDLHMLGLWVSTIAGVIVFAVIIYAMVAFRKSKGAVPATFTHSTKAEVIWTTIPALVLVFLVYETAPALIRLDDTRNSGMTLKITGYQWKWQYEYMGTDYSFFSTLTESSNAARQLNSGIDPASVEHYLLDVDNPLVLPVGVKIRYLLTANDVLHAWWVPAFGIKKDAVPGYINEGWFKVDEPGIYRGQCAELCGKDHGFMPIVVHAVPKDEFDAWLASKKTPAVAAN